MSKLRVAVVGGGHLGRIHAKLLSSRDDVHFVGVIDPSPASREAAQKLNVPVFDDYKSLSDEMDAVFQNGQMEPLPSFEREPYPHAPSTRPKDGFCGSILS